MRDWEEYKSLAYQVLNKPDLKRSVFLEGVILLESIIDTIILDYFFDRPLDDEIDISDRGYDFSKYILNDFSYKKKLDILEGCKIVFTEKIKALRKIGDDRNMAAHQISISLPIGGTDITWWFKGRKQRKTVRITDAFIVDYIERVSECYADLRVALLSPNNRNRGNLKFV